MESLLAGYAQLNYQFTAGATEIDGSLGMRVVRILVEQLRGTLDAGPRTDGNGACFTVKFPRSS